MIQGKTREETVQLTAAALGVSELEAEFIVAIELGEITSDVEVIEEETTVQPVPSILVADTKKLP